MPIEHSVDIKSISHDDLQALDYLVMGHAFALHRELGHFWHERIYQTELARRCREAGFSKVKTEVPIEVSYRDFRKTYYVDLIIDEAIVYELKTVRALTGEHQQQILNYLFLLGGQRGKLINFRRSSVEYRFVSTNIKSAHRFEYTIEDDQWEARDDDSVWLKQTFLELLKEWGVFLDTALFHEAIVYLRGGEQTAVQEMDVWHQGHLLGKQKVPLLNPETAFKISALTRYADCDYYKSHLVRLLKYTSLKTVQWINLNRNQVVFTTVKAI